MPRAVLSALFAPVSFASRVRLRAGRRAARRGQTLWVGLLSLLVVLLAAAAIGATLYAMRQVEERDEARENFARSSRALDQMLLGVASADRLKGGGAVKDREAIFKPALAYYQQVVSDHQGDPQMLPEVASAQLHAAALQAKLGDPGGVQTLNAGVSTVSQLAERDDVPAERIPGFQDCVLRIASPIDWFTMKVEDRTQHGLQLYLAIQGASTAYASLVKKFPDVVPFRDDYAELRKSTAQLMGAINRPSQSLDAWLEASATLETMVRDQPANQAFQTRLVESLVNSARLQRTLEQPAEGIKSLERAVEVRQKMADANPEDKSLAKAVESLKKDLESAKAAPEPKKVAKQEGEGNEASEAPKEPAPEAPEEEASQDAAKEEAAEPSAP
jgi:tetratricopeptide (TPR) repeat protein